jgi:Putative transposase
VVYAKQPFGGPEHVLHYLARYTHRVAISNHRLVNVADGQVIFRWKDYARGSRQRTMAVGGEEFLRRFLLHVLPRGLRAYPLLWIPCESAANPTTATLSTVAGGHLPSAPPSTPHRREEVTRFLVVSALRWRNGPDRKVHGTRDPLEISNSESLR